MPTAKEFTIQIEDRPGTLGKICQALADRSVNIIAFQISAAQGKSMARVIVDNPTNAKTVLETQKLTFTETEVALVKLSHRPGELARAAMRLGENKININYAYSGLEAGTNTPIVFFGVSEVGRAATLLDQVAGTAGRG
jgi:hypothetical protein